MNSTPALLRHRWLQLRLRRRRARRENHVTLKLATLGTQPSQTRTGSM
jgi:hypothetical protein